MARAVERAVASLEPWAWAEVRDAAGLEALRRVGPVAALQDALAETGLFQAVRLGLNQGLPLVSLSLKCKGADAAWTGPREGLGGVLLVMLGLHPEQEALEAAWQGAGLFANAVLDKFAQRTGVVLHQIKWNPRGTVCRTVFADRDEPGWRFGPSYLRFFRRDGALFCSDARHDLARAAADKVWEEIMAAHHVVDAELREALDPALHEYFLSGLLGPGETFQPLATNKLLAYYLWGGAGVGKSTFVGLLSGAMQTALREFVDPALQVHVVKVPLNSINERHLEHILRIQGISDWSVERMLEQAVAKENIAVLHLEENPHDPNTQEVLFGLVQGMVRHLLEKYPDRRCNVVYAVTSNYEACTTIAELSQGRVIQVQAPDADHQFHWAVDKLRQCVGSHVLVDESARPCAVVDMRPLNRWWLSIGFFCRQLLSESSSSSNCDIAVAAEDSGALQVRTDLKSLRLHSDDGFFFHLEGLDPFSTVVSMSASGHTTPGVVVLSESAALKQADLVARAVSQLEHVRHLDLGELKDDQDKEKLYGDASEIRGGLLRFIDDTNNPTVASEEVKDCLRCGLGHPCSFQFPEKPAATRQTRVALITASVTQSGQFMLREMLESGERSRTHRFSVSKTGVLFLTSLMPGHPITQQTLSRAHLVVS